MPFPFFIKFVSMYLMQDIIKFTEQLNVYNVLMRDSVRDEFIKLYSFTFDEMPACTGCPNDIEIAINKFMWMIKLHKNQTYLTKAKTLMKYQMKDKVRVYSTALNIVVTKYNCTDAIAEVLIRENESNKNLFIIAPDSEPKKAIETYSVINPKEETEVVTKKEFKKRGRKKKVA